jgi:G10 protein
MADSLLIPPFISFTGSRYIYDLYYEKEAISKQLYDWLLKNNYADANLIAKWKKQGYEKVSQLAASRSLSFNPPPPFSPPPPKRAFLAQDPFPLQAQPS